MSVFERPAPDIDAMATAWRAWVGRGADDEVLPGRTLADLKIAGTDLVLDTVAADHAVDSARIAPIAEAWGTWEQGKAGPAATLASLGDHGFGDIVEELADSP